MNFFYLNIAMLCLISTILLKKQQNTKLFLLCPRENFKSKILDDVLKNNVSKSEVVMVKIIGVRNNSSLVKEFELRVTGFDTTTFKYLKAITYSGYFDYKGYKVLVYGDSAVLHFFQMSHIHTYFDFLDNHPNDTTHNPPVAIEPNVYVYRVKQDIYTLKNYGMLINFE